MIFNNVNNILAVKDFETIYGDRLCRDNPELTNLFIKIYIDKEDNGWIKEWDIFKDSPYTCNHIVNEIMRCEDVYNKCNFTREEEFAVLAHELGHIVAGKRGEKSEISLQEEMKADHMAVSLGLASHMRAAIQKMIDANLKPSNNVEMRQRIDALQPQPLVFQLLTDRNG